MTGDVQDMRARLRLTLPSHWFADVAPVLDGLLAGFSSSWAALYGFLQLVRAQTRVGTAVEQFLDLAATDFFGARFSRRPGETDDAFRPRLQRAMLREHATRAALIAAAEEAGYTLQIFEPAQPSDTGVYNLPSGLAWSAAGGWGSLQMPFECLVTAQASAAAVRDALWQGVAETVPAGGAAWLRIQT